jgi:hypothetical protein
MAADGGTFGDVSAAGAAAKYSPRPMVPLGDADIQHFIRYGYIRIRPPTLGPEFHNGIAEISRTLNRGGTEYGRGWAGNDCYPAIPELGAVLSDPAVHGAITGLLGSGYALHPHRHCHVAEPGNKDQGIHQVRQDLLAARMCGPLRADGLVAQDSYEDDQATRHHRPRWAMLMYYPHRVDEHCGPTAVVPGSHFYNDPHGTSSGGSRHIV